MANWLNYLNQNATRNQPLDPKLIEALGFLPDMGVSMDVFSGGQPSSGPHRTGSHRHDNGDAADVYFNKGGRRLDWANPEDVPIFSDIVARAKAAGVGGIGAGEGYMRPGSMHIGFGTPAVWGAGGHGANAAPWLRAAYNGAPQGLTLNSNPVAPAASAIHPEIDPSIPPAAGVGVQPAGIAPMDGPKGMETTTGGKPSFWDNLKGAFKDPKSDLMGALGGLGGILQPKQQEQSAPIQSILPSMEGADAARTQGAAQLMATLLASKRKKSMGLNLDTGIM
jgi:hypothetical protein